MWKSEKQIESEKDELISSLKKINISYRDSDYFNDRNCFLFKDNYDKWMVSKVHWYNGSWFTNDGLKYKATTVKCIKLD